MKKTISRCFLFLILLSIPMMVSAAYQKDYNNRNYNPNNDHRNRSYDANRNSRASGEIRDIDFRNGRISISGDRKYDTVIVDGDTKIYAINGKRLSLRDLRHGDTIKVAGAERQGNSIHAVDIYISVNGSIYNPSGNSYDNHDHRQTSIKVTAVIRSLNSSSGRIRIGNVRNYDTVIVNSNTKIYNRNGRMTSLRNLQQDDSIKIIGYVNRSNDIIATEIRQE